MGWILDHFNDVGEQTGRCECGRPLRYEYHVKHVETGEHLCLGSTCIEHYTGLDAKTVQAVIKGMKVIDLEKDEILGKLINNWTNPIAIPEGFVVPHDVQQHLDLELPLLDRQISRLKKLIHKHRLGHMQTSNTHAHEENLSNRNQQSMDLFSFMDETAASTAPPVKRNSSVKKVIPIFNIMPDFWKGTIRDELQRIRNVGQTLGRFA